MAGKVVYLSDRQKGLDSPPFRMGLARCYDTLKLDDSPDTDSELFRAFLKVIQPAIVSDGETLEWLDPREKYQVAYAFLRLWFDLKLTPCALEQYRNELPNALDWLAYFASQNLNRQLTYDTAAQGNGKHVFLVSPVLEGRLNLSELYNNVIYAPVLTDAARQQSLDLNPEARDAVAAHILYSAGFGPEDIVDLHLLGHSSREL